MSDFRRYTVSLEQDGEDLVLPLDPELLAQMGWDIGDTLLWEEMGNGSFSIKKVESEDE